MEIIDGEERGKSGDGKHGIGITNKLGGKTDEEGVERKVSGIIFNGEIEREIIFD